MAKTIYFRQCRLHRPVENAHQVSWIPEKYAIKDKILKLKNSQNEWEDGWVVEAASTEKVPEDQLPDPHSDIKHHLRATGDVQKK